ncbi:hypothetical protein LINPERHAP2_LOCUS28306 [Linum perenne]
MDGPSKSLRSFAIVTGKLRFLTFIEKATG